MKLRTGLSHSILSILFAMDKRKIGKAITAARKALMSFVPRFLGVGHISCEAIIMNHTTKMAKVLFGEDQDVAILVAD